MGLSLKMWVEKGLRKMLIEPQTITDILLITPDIHQDKRGYFLESYHLLKYSDEGFNATFVQDNEAFSEKNVVRGLHYQLKYPQGKLIRCIQGTILDVAVDIREYSETYGQYVSNKLTSEKKEMMYVPEGFAHGYSVLSDEAIIQYKCTDYYHPEDEYGIKWNDPDLGIEWRINNPIVSEKDNSLPFLKNINNSFAPKKGI